MLFLSSTRTPRCRGSTMLEAASLLKVGSFRDMWGVGTLTIKSVSAAERLWVLKGDMGGATPPAADKKKPAQKPRSEPRAK